MVRYLIEIESVTVTFLAQYLTPRNVTTTGNGFKLHPLKVQEVQVISKNARSDFQEESENSQSTNTCAQRDSLSSKRSYQLKKRSSVTALVFKD